MTVSMGLLGLLAFIVMRGAPGSFLGRMLHRHLVEQPIEALSRFQRHHLIWLGVLLVLGLVASEIVVVFGLNYVLAFSLDLSLYLDTALVAAALASATRARTVWRTARVTARRWIARVGRVPKSPARRRAARPTPPKCADNDPEGPAVVPRAA